MLSKTNKLVSKYDTLSGRMRQPKYGHEFHFILNAVNAALPHSLSNGGGAAKVAADAVHGASRNPRQGQGAAAQVFHDRCPEFVIVEQGSN